MEKIGGKEDVRSAFFLFKSSNGTAFALSVMDKVLHIINNDGKTVKTVSKNMHKEDWNDRLDGLLRHLRGFQEKFDEAKSRDEEAGYATLPKDLAVGLATYK